MNILIHLKKNLGVDLESEVVSERIDEFIKNLDGKISEMKNDKNKNNKKNLQKLSEVKNNFHTNGNGYHVPSEPIVPKLPKSIATAINGIMGDIKMLKKEDEKRYSF